MTATLASLGIAFFWGGLLAVERRAFLQAMFSRPLVAATGLGLLLGDLHGGVFVGMVLELYYLGAANLGAALGENDTLAAGGAAALSATLAHASLGYSTPAIWSMAILLCVPLGRLGRKLDRALEGHSTALAADALRIAETGELRRAVRRNLWGIWPHFLAYGLAVAGCAGLGLLLSGTMNTLPLKVIRGLAWAYPAMASVAAAIAVRGSHAKRGPIWALGSAALVMALYLLFAPKGAA